MKILILGHTGTLGRYIHSYLSKKFDVYTINRKGLNALTTTTDQIIEIVKKYDVVVNCIGMLKKQQKEENVSIGDYMHINGVFPTALSVACDHTKTKLVCFSSDCVYGGGSGPYTELNFPDAPDPYGIAKSKEPIGCTVIRTSFIGEETPGRQRGLLEWLRSQSNNAIDGYTNCIWNGVTALCLAKLVWWIIHNDAFFKTTKHYHSLPPNGMSKYDLCVKINRQFNFGIMINPKQATDISGSVVEGTLDRRLLTARPDIQLPMYDFQSQLYDLKNYDF